MTVYSHSQLGMYEQCPLKYKLSYKDKIKRDTKGIEAFVGSRVHEVLQKCYEDIRLTKSNSIDDLFSFYDNQWQKNWNDSIVITKRQYTVDHYKAHGRKMIEDYCNRCSPFDADVTIGTEMLIPFSLDDTDKYKLRGFIDRLARTNDGTYEIHDYKTAMHLPTQEEADNDRQLCLYQIGVQKKWPDIKKYKLVWHYLNFDTDLISYRNPQAVSALVDTMKRLIDKIESTEEFLPAESALCDWCDYPDLCPQRKHFHKVESLPVNQYLKEPGVILVNKYAELKDKSSEISDEMEQVKEALLNYARTEQVGVIKGSDRMARVKFDTKLKLPGKNDKMRPELEDTIKRAGKWDEVSQLDTVSLVKAVEGGQWDKEFNDQVMKYGSFEETTSIRLSRLKEDEDD